jgi:hypothetical protein
VIVDRGRGARDEVRTHVGGDDRAQRTESHTKVTPVRSALAPGGRAEGGYRCLRAGVRGRSWGGMALRGQRAPASARGGESGDKRSRGNPTLQGRMERVRY